MKISAKKRKQAMKVIQDILKPTYFSVIPLDEIMLSLAEVGVVVLQEDATIWAGMLLGSDSRALFILGDAETAQETECGTVYTAYDNTCLCLSWYKSDSRTDSKTEVIGYIS